MDVLRDVKVIAATITGACKYSSLLRQLGVRTVLVEEAAEVLEPLLAAALPRTTEHLILVGDHQQLKPRPECHDLARDKKLNVSLPERVVRSRSPYCTLERQGRMRADIAELLHDMYPTLRTNEPAVAGNKVCVPL